MPPVFGLEKIVSVSLFIFCPVSKMDWKQFGKIRNSITGSNKKEKSKRKEVIEEKNGGKNEMNIYAKKAYTLSGVGWMWRETARWHFLAAKRDT